MTVAGSNVSPSSVLVIGNYPQTLAVVRSLGRAGFHVVLGDFGDAPIAMRSRFCHESWQCPALENLEAFQRALLDLLRRRPDVRHIFPVAEGSMRALMSITSLSEFDVNVIMVAPNLVLACLDKRAANELAVRAGLLIPETRFASTYDRLEECCQAIDFPVIVKPLTSARRLSGRKALVMASREDLRELLPEWPPEHETLMIQRYVEGTLEAADFVARSGGLVGYCEAHSVRTDMLDGTGFGVEFESIPPSPDVLAATQSFISGLDYSGPGLIQFMRSASDGGLYFLENNPRLSAGVADSIACGQDMPLLSLQAMSRRPEYPLRTFTVEKQPYRIHHHTYWLHRDIQGLLTQRSKLSFSAKLGWFRNMLRSFARADSHITWQWDDPSPCLRIYARLVSQLYRELVR